MGGRGDLDAIAGCFSHDIRSAGAVDNFTFILVHVL